jgi:hypothetical protein
LHTCTTDLFHFFSRKKSLFTKHIDIIGQFFFTDHRQHFVYDQINIAFVIFPVHQWESMGTQECRPDCKSRFFFQLFDNSQHFQFVCYRQTIAAFYFDRPCSHLTHFIQVFPGEVE